MSQGSYIPYYTDYSTNFRSVKMGVHMETYSVIIDTKEQQPWDFSIYDACAGSIDQHLDEGDYTSSFVLEQEELLDEKILRIERKASTAELATNLGKDSDRFYREMERMADYRYKFIICEFTKGMVFAFPQRSGIPKNRWYRKNNKGKIVSNLRMNGKLMMSRIHHIQTKWGVETLFCSSRDAAIQRAHKIILEVHDKYNRQA